ncbi:MAG: hypothetical protein K6F55_05335, partial [Eubacterium sp.]|nr:hypothetical protein [Eubacterium sp.]
MIPALIFAAVAAGGVFTAAGQSVIKDSKKEIESVNNESQRMIDETKQIIERTNEEAKKAYNGLISQRKNIYTTTFKKANELTEKIKISSKVDLKNEISDFNESISSVDYSIISSAKVSTGIITGVSALGGLGGLVVGTIISGVALEYKKDEAHANKEKIRAECEKAKLDCTRMQNVTCVMNDSKKTIRALNRLAKKSEERVE